MVRKLRCVQQGSSSRNIAYSPCAGRTQFPPFLLSWPSIPPCLGLRWVLNPAEGFLHSVSPLHPRRPAVPLLTRQAGMSRQRDITTIKHLIVYRPANAELKVPCPLSSENASPMSLLPCPPPPPQIRTRTASPRPRFLTRHAGMSRQQDITTISRPITYLQMQS